MIQLCIKTIIHKKKNFLMRADINIDLQSLTERMGEGKVKIVSVNYLVGYFENKTQKVLIF